MKKVEKLLDDIKPIKAEIKKRCLAYLKRQLKNHKRLDFVDEDGDIGNECVCVSYDGGRHPEYDAYPFSQVYAIYLENNNIMLEIEECGEYEISRITWDELVSLANYVYKVIIPTLKKKKDYLKKVSDDLDFEEDLIDGRI